MSEDLDIWASLLEKVEKAYRTLTEKEHTHCHLHKKKTTGCYLLKWKKQTGNYKTRMINPYMEKTMKTTWKTEVDDAMNLRGIQGEG